PYDGHLDLTGILHVLFDAVGDVTSQQHGRGVVDLVGLDDDPDLAPSLDGEGVLDPREAGRDALEAFETFDVALQRLAARARPGGRDGVGGVDDDGEEGLGAVEVVVVRDRVDNLARFAETPAEVGADLGVGALDLPVDRLADVVKQPGAARHGFVDADLGGD